jgi:hypothetical protein
MARRGRKQKSRGSALILTVLILFAMLALGLLAMRSATQNISGSGNLRLSVQARHVAEMGLYHAVTLMNRQGSILLPLRDGAAELDSTIEIQSPRQDTGPQRSRVRILNAEGDFITERIIEAPPFFSEGPPGLGIAGVNSDAKPSYTVSVSGFQPWTCPAGYDEQSLRRNGQGCCLVHFESRAVISSSDAPTQALLDDRNGAELFAEHSMKAGVVIGPLALRGCNR